jgi:hypothetical protein
MIAPPGVARTLVPFGSVSVTSTWTSQACFAADCAQQADAEPSIQNATANEIFMKFPRM